MILVEKCWFIVLNRNIGCLDHLRNLKHLYEKKLRISKDTWGVWSI